jgi:glutathione synthase/RimK-type ligase-like ATP-grasp enzyme
MNKTLIITDDSNFKFERAGISTISFTDYVSQYPQKNEGKIQIINFCETKDYLSKGYYCSLLGEARKHKMLPSVSTINDLRKLEKDDENFLFMKGSYLNLMKSIQASKITSFNIYFGIADNEMCQKIAKWVFDNYPSPILHVQITQNNEERFVKISSRSFSELTESEKQNCIKCLQTFISKNWRLSKKEKRFRWDMAILVNPDEEQPPSDKKAIQLFIKAAEKLGIHAACITKKNLSSISQYDALFIREGTAIDHYTYKLARKAEQEGIVAIDDSNSILRCCNKVYLHDAYSYNQVNSLKTIFVYDDNPSTIETIESTFAYPMVIKMPESSFSKGVHKANNKEELQNFLKTFLSSSALVLIQEYMYTPFDWRIGVLNGRPIFACKYYMAANHWQIYSYKKNKVESGKFETLPTFEVPKSVLNAAIKASKIVGNGLYGVDLKQKGKQVYLVEVNDNPNIDSGVEDLYLGNELYMLVMLEFLNRLEKRGK